MSVKDHTELEAKLAAVEAERDRYKRTNRALDGVHEDLAKAESEVRELRARLPAEFAVIDAAVEPRP